MLGDALGALKEQDKHMSGHIYFHSKLITFFLHFDKMSGKYHIREQGFTFVWFMF